MRAAPKAALAGAATVAAYTAVVIATTPALEPAAAVFAAVSINHAIMAGMGAGVGLQVYVSERAKALGCKTKLGAAGRSSGAAATSFFSFFSLVPLGCCGWWLYALSLLPGVLGVGASAVLIEHSQALAYAGFAAVFGFAIQGAMRLRRAAALVKAD